MRLVCFNWDFQAVSAGRVQTGNDLLFTPVENNVFAATLFGKFLWPILGGFKVRGTFHPYENILVFLKNIVPGQGHLRLWAIAVCLDVNTPIFSRYLQERSYGEDPNQIRSAIK
jgi:hypothetical protein